MRKSHRVFSRLRRQSASLRTSSFGRAGWCSDGSRTLRLGESIFSQRSRRADRDGFTTVPPGEAQRKEMRARHQSHRGRVGGSGQTPSAVSTRCARPRSRRLAGNRPGQNWSANSTTPSGRRDKISTSSKAAPKGNQAARLVQNSISRRDDRPDSLSRLQSLKELTELARRLQEPLESADGVGSMSRSSGDGTRNQRSPSTPTRCTLNGTTIQQVGIALSRQQNVEFPVGAMKQGCAEEIC